MKRQSAWVAWALVVGTLAYMVGVAVGSNGAVVEVPGFKGFATATALHVDAIQSGTTRLVDTELAFSAAAANSDTFTGPALQNEMQVTIQPNNTTSTPNVVFTGKNTSGRGSGLEIGLNNGVPSAVRTTLAQNVAEAVSPPQTPPPPHPITKQTNVPVNPLAYASLLRGQALANWSDDPCLFGPQTPLAFGLGYIADAQLVNAPGGTQDSTGFMSSPVVATDDPNPARAVSQSRSFMYAFPNGDAGKYGLVSETRTTFAPVNIARGGPTPLPPVIIEILGEWIFRATAPGNAPATIDQTVEINGEQPSPTTTVIKISVDGGGTYTDIAFQDLFPDEGVVVPSAISAVLAGAIAEDARAIATAVPPATVPVPDPLSQPTLEADGTEATGAADVIRLQLLNAVPGGHVADLRLGHQEASAVVPEGGFSCATVATTTTTTTTPSTSTSSTSTTSSTTTTSTSTTTTSTTAAPTTTTTAAPSSTTAAPPSTTSPPTTAAPQQPPPPAPPARPVVVSPSFVG